MSGLGNAGHHLDGLPDGILGEFRPTVDEAAMVVQRPGFVGSAMGPNAGAPISAASLRAFSPKTTDGLQRGPGNLWSQPRKQVLAIAQPIHPHKQVFEGCSTGGVCPGVGDAKKGGNLTSLRVAVVVCRLEGLATRGLARCNPFEALGQLRDARAEDAVAVVIVAEGSTTGIGAGDQGSELGISKPCSVVHASHKTPFIPQIAPSLKGTLKGRPADPFGPRLKLSFGTHSIKEAGGFRQNGGFRCGEASEKEGESEKRKGPVHQFSVGGTRRRIRVEAAETTKVAQNA